MRLAAFGKHPGWNDHIDDLGLETDRLVAIKRILYLEGIGAAIDSGAWDKLHETQRTPGFNHVLVWRTGDDVAIARMWSSSDGKGRTKYPMIVCAQCRGVPLRTALERVLPALESLQRSCQGTGSAEEVRSLLAAARSRLRADLAGPFAGEPSLVVPADTVSRLASDPAFAGGEGLQRILYQIEREMGPYLSIGPGGKSRLGSASTVGRSRIGEVRPQQIRVPACGASGSGGEAGEVALRWTRFLLALIDPVATTVVIVPIGEAWVDLIVGEPTGQQFFCIRAAPKALPLTSDIPYTIDPAFLSGVQGLLSGPLPGGDVVMVFGRSSGNAAAAAVAAKLGWSRQAKVLALAGAGGIVLAALLAGGLLLGGGGPGGETAAERPAPEPTRTVSATPSERAPAARPPSSPREAPREGPREGEFDDAQWRELCELYQEWAGPLLRKLDEPRRARFRGDPELAGLLACLGEGGEKNDPWSIAGVERGPISHLIREPPRAVTTPEGIRRTGEALRCLRSAGAALSPSGWSRLAALSEAAGEFRSRGWTAAHAAVTAAVIAAEPKAGNELAEAIDAVLSLSAAVEGLQRRWGAVEGLASELAATGDPVLQRYAPWAARHSAGTPAAGSGDAGAILREVDARLAEAQGIGEELARFVRSEGWATIDQDAFKGSSRAHRALAGGREADLSLFRDWLFEAPSYPAPDTGADPRRQWLEVSLRGGDGSIAGGREPRELAAAAAAAEALRAYLAQHGAPAEEQDHRGLEAVEDLRRQAAELSRRRWSAADRGEIESQAGRIARQSEELALGLQRRLAELRNRFERNFAEVVARLREREAVTASPSLNELWRSQRDALIAAMESATQGRDVPGLLSRAAALEDSIGALAAAGRAAELPDDLGSGAWVAPIKAEAAARRELVLRGAAAAVGKGEGIDSLTTRVTATLAAEFAKLEAVARDAAALERLLAAGYGLRERTGAGAGGTVAEVAERLRLAAAQVQQAGLGQALTPLLERAGQLAAIASASDRSALAEQVRAARADAPEQSLAAWRRLGELAWPGSAAELAHERALREALARVLGTLRDPQRREHLEQELAAQAVVRFERGALAAATPQELDTALAQLADFGLSARDLRDPALRFNVALRELRHELNTEGMDESGARAVVAAFIGGIKAELGADVLAGLGGARAIVESLESELAAASAPQPPRPKIDFSTLGPGRLGPPWRAEADPGDLEVVFRRPVPVARGREAETLELRFIRVATGDGGGVYLLAGELTLGQAIAIVETQGDWDEFQKLYAELFSQATDSRRGPRVWSWAEDAQKRVLPVMRPSPTWLRYSQWVPAAQHHAEGLHAGRPTPQHPIQQIPPDAAVYLAALVGCRLPTSQEWLAAYGAHARDLPLEEANLRDATWKRQQAYVESLRNAGTVFEWPDAGVFWPAGSRNDPRELAAESHDWNDGTLWFLPAASGAGGGIEHLVGNVAEFVFEDPAVFAGLAAPEPEAVQRLLNANASRLGVIGGSALSAPNLDVAVRHAVDYDESQDGFSDVGVRLAFAVDPSLLGPRGVLGAARELSRPSSYLLRR